MAPDFWGWASNAQCASERSPVVFTYTRGLVLARRGCDWRTPSGLSTQVIVGNSLRPWIRRAYMGATTSITFGARRSGPSKSSTDIFKFARPIWRRFWSKLLIARTLWGRLRGAPVGSVRPAFELKKIGGGLCKD